MSFIRAVSTFLAWMSGKILQKSSAGVAPRIDHLCGIAFLRRHVDSEGRLHSTRLLTIHGANLPSIFKPFVPTRNFYLIEEVVVDPQAQTMKVHTVSHTILSSSCVL